MKRIYSFLFVIFSTTTFAQYSYSSGGAFTFGVQSLPASDLAGFFEQTPELSNTSFSFGGYGVWQVKNFMFGFKGAGVYGAPVEENGLQYRHQAGYWSADIGYKIINRDKFGFYPLIGIGYGGVSYSISSTEDIDVSTGQVLNGGDFNWNGLVIDVGFRAEHLFGFKSAGSGKGGGILGLEAGYMFSPQGSDWTTNGGGDIIGGPDFSMNGFYARLLIGGMGGR
jgi:hypothetical protein